MVVRKDNHEANKKAYHIFLKEMQQGIHFRILQGKAPSLERHGYSPEEIKYLGFQVGRHSDFDNPPCKLVLNWYVPHMMKGTINYRDPHTTEASWDGAEPKPKEEEK
mgnify:CR=1 FL=1